MAEISALVGQRFGSYDVQEILGKGGMGVVYRAWHRNLQRRDALKFISPELAADPSFRQRFETEWKIAAALAHANVVAVYDAGERDGHLFIAMRYVDGTDLASLLASQGPLKPRRALSIIGQAASALDAAHRQHLVHRDVKPPNLLLESDRVFVSDFGLAKDISENVAQSRVAGTPPYMAPEQWRNEPVDARTDVYALGCVLYETLAGHVPFEQDSIGELAVAHMSQPPPSLKLARTDLPDALDDVILKALAKATEDRFTSCREMVAAARAAVYPKRSTRASTTPKHDTGLDGLRRAAVPAAAVAAALLVKGWLGRRKRQSTQGMESAPNIPLTDRLLIGTWHLHEVSETGSADQLALRLDRRGVLTVTSANGEIQEGRWRLESGSLVTQVGTQAEVVTTFSITTGDLLSGTAGSGHQVIWRRALPAGDAPGP